MRYTTYTMKKITPTILRRAGWHQYLALTITAILTLLVVLQLFWFEELPRELAVSLPVEWVRVSSILAALFVIGEVLAVAYFLPIALSPLARWCTRVLAVCAPLGWIAVTAYSLVSGQAANVAYLGAKFDIALTWTYVAVMAALLAGVVAVVITDLRKS